MKYLAANEALNDLYANTEYELAYDGAKSMLLLDNLGDLLYRRNSREILNIFVTYNAKKYVYKHLYTRIIIYFFVNYKKIWYNKKYL